MAVARRLIGALASIIIGSLPLAAQSTGAIRGRVVDSASNQGLSNVMVTVEGTSLGVFTNLEGAYTLAGVSAGAHRVHARRIGFHSTTRDVSVSAGSTVTADFRLAPQPAVLTEMVVTGYGSQRREAITGAVSTVETKEANVGVITNATQLLEGRATGVQIVQSSGEPGGNTQIRIRGGTSISASNDPLYVIDGVPMQNDATTPDASGVAYNAALSRNPLNSINPNDIETITILKDASATAIYGSRAANGVILITTKRGTRDSQVEYEVYTGVATPAKTMGLANGAQYRAFVTQFKDSLGGQSAVDALGNANTDWEKELTRTANSMSHNLAFTGGSAQTKYRASLNYFNEQGIIPNSALTRYQGRLNGTHDALDGRIRLALNLMASRLNNSFSPNENGGGFTGGLFTNMAIYNPTKPVRNADGTFYETGTGAQDVRNPVAMVNQLTDKAPENRLLGNISATFGLRDWLTAQSTVGADNTDATRQFYAPRTSPIGAAFSGYARQADRRLQNTNFQQLLTFTPKMSANHELEVVAGYEYIKNDNREFDAATQGFITDAYGVDNLAAGTATPVGYPYSWHTESELSSFFSRANYGYAGKYFVTAVLRRDGSSRLAPGHQWAAFPGLSASWRMTDESFMRNHPLKLSSLALRAGWGKQGNQAVAPYQTQLLLKSDAGSLYPFGGVITTGLAAVQVGNPNLRWETAEQTNLGADFGFLNDRITGGIEIYQKNTHDLLLNRAVPQPAVVASRIENVGSLRNRGLEASADMNIYSRGNRTLSGGIVLTVERNNVTSLGDTTVACAGDSTTTSFRAATAAKCSFIETGGVYGQGQSNQWSQIIMRGQALGTFLAPKFVEVKNGQQYFACTAATPDCKNGETTNPVDADRQFIGTANPSFTVGLRNNGTWGSFDASWLWRGEFGGKVFNNTALVYQTKSDAAQGRNFIAAAIGMPDNVHEPAKLSSRWIEDRTFVRLQNLTVGYTLPKSMLGGRPTRVYATGDNMLLLTHYSGYDPEVYVASGVASRGIDYVSYPPTRRFTIGARTQF
jgi:TonB-dependent starch-binding outer membrane protein SusC